MRDLFRDPEVLQRILRTRMLRAGITAAGKLIAIVNGSEQIKNDGQLQAALALARMTPLLTRDDDNVELSSDYSHPRRYTAQACEFWERMFKPQAHERRLIVDLWQACFNFHGPQPGRFNTKAEAIAYGNARFDRIHPPTSTDAQKADFHSRQINGEELS